MSKSFEAGFQFANKNDLRDLHELTRTKLMRRCMPRRDSQVLGMQHGLYIAKDPVSYTLELSPEEVRSISSIGAEILKASEGLDLTYIEEYYAYHPAQEHVYEADTCTYEVRQPADDPVDFYWYSVMVYSRDWEGREDSPLVDQKEVNLRNKHGGGGDQRLRGVIESRYIEAQLGMNRTSRDECWALLTIVDGIS